MKAKQSIVLISILVAGIVLARIVFPEEVESFDPDFSKMEEIGVVSGKWHGQFWPNGAARLQGFPSHDECWDRANAPEGSFLFEEIYSLVASHLKPMFDPNSKKGLAITFFFNAPDARARGTPLYYCFRIEDKQVIRTLMHGLREKTVPMNETAKTYLEELYSKYPLVPGEAPDSFRYGFFRNLDKGTKMLCGSIFIVLCVGAVLWFIRKKKKKCAMKEFLS